MSRYVPQPTKTRYGGRFRFDLSVDFKLRGEGAHVKGVQVRGVDLPPAPTIEAACSAFWKKHLADVRAMERSDESSPMIEEGELRPGVPRLLYRGYGKNDLALETLLSDHQRAVLIVAEWRQSYKPEDRPAENAEHERAFNEVVNAFSFLSPGHAGTDVNAFYVEQGAVRLPYSASSVEHLEHFEIGLDHPTQSARFDFEYDYIKAPSDEKPPGFLARVANAVARSPGVSRPIRTGHRVVAGFPGEEAVLRSKDNNSVNYLWLYEPAENATGFQPAIKIMMDSDDGDLTFTTGLWDQTLAGIQRLVP